MQSFDYEQVSTKMQELKIVFTEFAKRLDTMDKKYTENIAVDANCALYGSKADKVISHWNHLARSFAYFDKEFTEVYDLVQKVAAENRAFEDEVAGIANSASEGPTTVRGCGSAPVVRGCGSAPVVRGCGGTSSSSVVGGGGAGGGAYRVNMVK